jgi:hypothetical protein
MKTKRSTKAVRKAVKKADSSRKRGGAVWCFLIKPHRLQTLARDGDLHLLTRHTV